jgi:hypothetical protein
MRYVPGLPVDFYGFSEHHVAFLDESRTRGCVWCAQQEILVPRRLRYVFLRAEDVRSVARAREGRNGGWMRAAGRIPGYGLEARPGEVRFPRRGLSNVIEALRT